MAEDIQQLKNQVWYAKQKVQVEEKIRDDWATSVGSMAPALRPALTTASSWRRRREC